MFPTPPAVPRLLPLALAALCATGCAATPNRDPRDPLEPMNRAVYRFNDAVDRHALRPVAVGYRKVVPEFARTGIHNFFENLFLPIDIGNDLLQLKPLAALRDTARLVINTTIGLAGFVDAAQSLGLNDPNEDFGQTLGRWGVPAGPYLVLPLVGPSTLRDGLGEYGADSNYLDPLRDHTPEHERWNAKVLEGVQKRSELLSLDGTLQDAFDPYTFVRDAYLQRRVYLIHDGRPPVADDPYEDPLDDPAAADPAAEEEAVPPPPPP
jgi:phospholipid-binding lipoprotein MlaA